jgi:hypothetical protein
MSLGQGIPKVQHFRYVHPSSSRADLTSRALRFRYDRDQALNQRARGSKACARCVAERFHGGGWLLPSPNSRSFAAHACAQHRRHCGATKFGWPFH